MVKTRDEVEKRFKQIFEDAPQERIERVKADLERYAFSPAFLLPVKKSFLTMTKAQLREEIDRVLEMDDAYLLKRASGYSDDPQQIRCTQINLLLYYYDLLTRLRKDIPEAWDEIHELYEDD